MEDISFVVNPRDKLAIIGEEGNGKSTLLHYILDDPSIQSYLDIEGQMINHFDRIGYLPQSLDEQALGMTIEDFFFQSLDPSMIDYNLLYQLGSQLNFDIDRLYSQQLLKTLSGGERIKIQLIRLVIKDNDLLLLDEPSNDLDIETLGWLEQFIQQSERAIIFISHDVSLLEKTATSVLHLERLQHKERTQATFSNTSYSQYMQNREAKFNKQLDIALNQREEHDKKLARHHRIEQSVTHQLRQAHDSTAGRLLAKKMHAVKSTSKRLEREESQFEEIPIREDAIDIRFSHTKPIASSKPILTIHDESITIAHHVLATNLKLNVYPTDKLGIFGQNGIGKSSFLKMILPQLLAKEALNVGYMPQNYEDSLKNTDTPIDYLTLTGSVDEKTQIMTYLGSMKFLPEEMIHPITDLSGGQRAKLLLLKFDLQGQNILLLDEPTRNFSPTSQAEIRDVFKRYPGAIISVSHDRQFLKDVCNRIVELTPNGFIERDFDSLS